MTVLVPTAMWAQYDVFKTGTEADIPYRIPALATAKDGSLIAADLVMCPKVMSNMVSDGSHRKTVRTFTLEIADVKKGRLMWIYTKQLGFTRHRGVVGF